MAQSSSKNLRASAHPTKAFFVWSLTRDISLEDCILDLVDNSVDAAWRQTQAVPIELKASERLKGFRVEIDISEDQFRISDNCGGISLDEAVEYAFTFGRRGREPDDELPGYTVGVYGIGMKRAVFKLGDKVKVRSTPADDSESFEVPINVEEWMAPSNDEWDFAIDPAESLPSPGVEITVDDLAVDTRSTFSDPAFDDQLRHAIARDYMLPLMHGLTISLNGTEVGGWSVTFRQSRDFSPMRQRYEDDGVTVEIIAGMTAPPPDDSGPDETQAEDESGWYVLCNGRVVVARDRSKLTVWGRNRFPSWHPQYKGFTGVVLFAATDPSLLPMTTTKRSVDPSSGLYRRAVTRMQNPTRTWIDYTNAWKSRREEAKAKEEAAKAVPIAKVKDRRSIKLPASASGPKDANIAYTVPKDRVERLGTAFGKSTMTNKEVGERSFEYAYQREVTEDE